MSDNDDDKKLIGGDVACYLAKLAKAAATLQCHAYEVQWHACFGDTAMALGHCIDLKKCLRDVKEAVELFEYCVSIPSEPSSLKVIK